MKNLYIIILIVILFFCSGAKDSIINIAVSYQPNVEKLEQIFKTHLPIKEGIIYTKVPRGLVLSIDERWFFNKGEARIKESSLCILDTIAVLLTNLPNYCVIENHTGEENFENSDYKENWELSIARASNIAEYLVKYKHLHIKKVFPLGYGEFMPFKDNVGESVGMDNRVDFVIIEYDAKR